MVSPIALIAITAIIGLGITLFLSMLGSMADYSFTSKQVYEIENDRIREDLEISYTTLNNIITLNVTSKWTKSSTLNGIIVKAGSNYYLCELNSNIEPLSANNIIAVPCSVNFDSLSTFNVIVTTKLGNAIVAV